MLIDGEKIINGVHSDIWYKNVFISVVSKNSYDGREYNSKPSGILKGLRPCLLMLLLHTV